MHAGVQVRVDHQAATQEGVDEQVQKTLELTPAPRHQFRHAGGRGVLGKADRQIGQLLHFGGQVELVPARRLFLRQPQQTVPATELERRRNTYAHQARGQLGTQLLAQVRHMLAEHRQQGFGLRKRVGQVLAQPHLAGEVDQQPVGAAPADLDADRKSPVRVQRQRHRGLADASSHRLMAQQQIVFFQPGRDQAYGLRSEPGQARQIGLGQAAMGADGLQHHPLIELPHADVVGASRPEHGPRGRAMRSVFKGAGAGIKVHGRRFSPITPLRRIKFPNGCSSPVTTMA